LLNLPYYIGGQESKETKKEANMEKRKRVETKEISSQKEIMFFFFKKKKLKPRSEGSYKAIPLIAGSLFWLI